MITRTFQAATLREAMKRVHEDLGEEAVILGTRQVRDARDEGPPRFEVTASTSRAPRGPQTTRRSEDKVETRQRERTAEASPLPSPGLAAPLADPPPRAPEPRPREEEADHRDLRGELSVLHGELASLRAEIPAWRERDTDLRGAVEALRTELRRLTATLRPGRVSAHDADDDVRRLVEAGVEPSIAGVLVERARARVAPRQGLAVAQPPDLSAELLHALPTAPPLWSRKPLVAALVGPTGVGKTRTVAKLAAISRFVHNARVGIVTSDMHRIGGTGTLQGFCEVLGLPLRRARDRRGLRAAVQAFGDRDLILVDTAGCSPRDEQALAWQDRLLDGDVERHLVVPAAAPSDAVRELARRFTPEGADSVMVTKLDEARGPGAVLSAAWGSDVPISHVCDGQRVPDACHAAEPEDLVRRILSRKAA